MEVIQVNSIRSGFDGVEALRSLINRKYKTIDQRMVERMKISESAKKISNYISQENLAGKIPTRKDVIRDLDDIKFTTVDENLKLLMEKNLAIRVRIFDILYYYLSRGVIKRRGARFELPASLSWLETYLNEIGGSGISGVSWVKKLEYAMRGNCSRYSYHYVSLTELNGKPCYEPLGLIIIK